MATEGLAAIVAMCDIRGMAKLHAYIARFPDRTQQDWAKRFGISRSFFAEIVSGRKYPGRKTMITISKETDGEVPVAAWFDEPEPGPEGL